MLINIIDYPTIQAALDAAIDGDRVYLPRGCHEAPEGGWVIRTPLTVMGDFAPRPCTDVTHSRGVEGRDGTVFAIEPKPGAGHVGVVFQDLRFIGHAALPAIVMHGAPGATVSLAFDSVRFGCARESKTKPAASTTPSEASRC